jgi:membrane protease subunit HflK
MADENVTPPDDAVDPPPPRPPVDPTSSVPVEGDGEERGAPRRVASAEFDVDSGIGSEAMMREAMDPANQSLAEALRLSYRVLQVVILVLVVLFVFSGFQVVQPTENGVLLRWGRILTKDGSKALGPGRQFSKWPYPAGEFVIFQSLDRSVRLAREFWPDLGGMDLESAVGNASINDQLQPGRGQGKDGYLLARGADIAHLQIDATYDIDYPERTVHAVRDQRSRAEDLDADRLVSLSLQRAAVHFAARRTLEEIVELADSERDELRRRAQEVLDLPAIDAGIRITNVDIPGVTPALAIKRAYTELQEARVRSDEMITLAVNEKEKALADAAGTGYGAIVEAIVAYEDAFERGNRDEAEDALLVIHERLEGASGEAAQILGIASAYRSQVDSTLGREARRFMGHLETYRSQPSLLVSRLWMDAYAAVLSQDDAEKFFAPNDGTQFRIAIAGSDQVRQTRRSNDVERRETEAWLRELNLNPYIQRGSDMREGPGRSLRRDATGLGGGR